MVKNLLKSSLMALNGCVGVGGIAIIVYGVLMIRVWQPDDEDSSYFHKHLTLPWFFHAFLGVGIALCAITCLGHVAARTANDFCLSCYIVIILLLLISEAVIMADAFLNSRWKKELPKELHERLDEFEDFVDSNDEIWKWVAWFIFLVQAISVLLATVQRILKGAEVDSHESEDEDQDEDAHPWRPLLGRSALERRADPSIV